MFKKTVTLFLALVMIFCLSACSKEESNQPLDDQSSTLSQDEETPTHTHNYLEATCTSPNECSCGAISGTALGHNYVNNECSRCGKIDPDSLPKELFSTVSPYETKGCSKKTVKINGEQFANAFIMTGGYADGSGAHAYFNLSSKYHSLNFEIGHVDGSYLEDVVLEIITDGITVKTIYLKSTDLKKQYTIEISGVNQLVIKQSYTVAKYAIINATLSK